MARRRRADPAPKQPADPTSNARVKRVLGNLKSVAAREQLEQPLRIARAVLDGAYDGDIEQWRIHGTRSPCFREILEHPDLPVTQAALKLAMRVYDLWHRAVGIIALENIWATHLVGVLGLPAEIQLELLTRAVREGWPSDELLEQARAHRIKVYGRGRPRSPRVLRTLRWLEKLTLTAWADRYCLDYLDLPAALRARATVARTMRWLERLARQLDRRIERDPLGLQRLVLVDSTARRAHAEALAVMLEDAGFSVYVCESGAQALALRRLSFDCAVIVASQARTSRSDVDAGAEKRDCTVDDSRAACEAVGAELVRMARASACVIVPALELERSPPSGLRFREAPSRSSNDALGASDHLETRDLIEIPESEAARLVALVTAALPAQRNARSQDAHGGSARLDGPARSATQDAHEAHTTAAE